MKKPLHIKPAPGYLLCEPYIEKDKPFVSAKEITGEDRKYIVLEVGDSITDSEGIERTSPCKQGDTIIGVDSNKTFEIDFTRYYFLHYTEVHGVWKP